MNKISDHAAALRRLHDLHRHAVFELFLERLDAAAEGIIILRAQTAQPHGAQLGLYAAVRRRAHPVERVADDAAPRDKRRGREAVAQSLKRFHCIRR